MSSNALFTNRRFVTPALFTSTIFLSASLLFFVQPLFTKIVLPLVGGAPAVWTTAMLFFQTILIAGYLYAHLSTKYLPVIAQVTLHVLFWACALITLPLSVQAGWRFDPQAPVALQTLLLFALGVGLPFAVLSANAPLIQSWYANSDGPSADDPYFLYGASNFGSLVALLAFPLLAEPFFGADQISWGWSAGFVVLGVLLGLSGLAARNGARRSPPAKAATRPALKTYGRWLLLAFVPSSLMLAITTKISTDLGAFPLVWVIPLSLFLLTFVMTFTNRPWIGPRAQKLFFVLGLGALAIMQSGVQLDLSTLTVTALLVLSFFAIAITAHRTLYDSRPSKENLTIFYVTMSVGGALGGLFNSLIAPVAFVELDELRVTTILAAALLIAAANRPNKQDITQVIVVLSILIAPFAVQNTFGTTATYPVFAIVVCAVVFGALILKRDHALSCLMIVLTVVGLGKMITSIDALFHDRSFFGSHLVFAAEDVRIYRNGTTTHGAQLQSDIERGSRPTPLFYYHPDAPMAQVLNSTIGARAKDIGIVGQGVGSLACYARPGQAWQFYEIDQMVDQIARNPRLFTFMSNCTPDAPTHIGDARVVLEQQTDLKYDILVIDAYSSDAVPVHLTTNEAMTLYFDRLNDGGVLLLHISNRYYDISLPLGRSADALGHTALIQHYAGDRDEIGNSASIVVAMARNTADLAPLQVTGLWTVLQSDGNPPWTDNHANPLSILMRRNGG